MNAPNDGDLNSRDPNTALSPSSSDSKYPRTVPMPPPLNSSLLNQRFARSLSLHLGEGFRAKRQLAAQ